MVYNLYIMSENALGAENQQGSPLTHIMSYDPSETTRRAPSITFAKQK